MKPLLMIAACLLAVGFARAQARAACSDIDTKIASAQRALAIAEPAHDASVADFERRLDLVAEAQDAVAGAETTRETTPGGCGDLQQLYGILMTTAWTNLELAYFKPSIDFYVASDDCRAVSRLQTIAAVAEAYEIMNRSLISWNPVSRRTTDTRDHVTRMAIAAAAYLGIELPPPEEAETLARTQKFRLDVARSRVSSDCVGTLPALIPKAIARSIFVGS